MPGELDLKKKPSSADTILPAFFCMESESLMASRELAPPAQDSQAYSSCPHIRIQDVKLVA